MTLITVAGCVRTGAERRSDVLHGDAEPVGLRRIDLELVLRRVELQVAVGDEVRAGQALLCVEAMKMEMWLTAQAPGRVVALHLRLGEQVESGALLVEIELSDKKET